MLLAVLIYLITIVMQNRKRIERIGALVSAKDNVVYEIWVILPISSVIWKIVMRKDFINAMEACELYNLNSNMKFLKFNFECIHIAWVFTYTETELFIKFLSTVLFGSQASVTKSVVFNSLLSKNHNKTNNEKCFWKQIVQHLYFIL